MAKAKSQNDPFPVPETMEEFREMARDTMALLARTAELAKLHESRLAKTEKLVDRISKLSGDTNRNTGRVLEQEVAAKVGRDGKIAWMRADEMYPQLVKMSGDRVVGEYDLVIANGSELMVVEVKRVLRADEVRKFAAGPLAKFRARFPEIAGDRAIYGALAFSLEEDNIKAREEALKAAQDAGLLLIRAVGKTGLKILNPRREKLRAAGAGGEKQNKPR